MAETPISYPERIEIEPLLLPPVATVRVPGSKSITNRALVLAALTNGGCQLRGVLRSEDTELMANALAKLGFTVEICWERDQILVRRPEGKRLIPSRRAKLFCGNSGTTMRFLTALVSLGQGEYFLDGVARMRERPIQDLLDALQQIGVDARSKFGNGCPPVQVTSQGLRGGNVKIRGNVSSQFLSGLLMAAPMARGDTTIEVDGALVSEPYVKMTLRMMRDFEFVLKSSTCFKIPGNQRASLEAYDIEPDASAASYFLAAAAITEGRVTVPGLHTGDSLQGDTKFAHCLQWMGCKLEESAGITIQGAPLHGIDVDMNAISDTVMTLAAVACFAEGPTTIRNVAHIRHKETDRLNALAVELRKVGVGVEEFEDGLRITPGPLHGAVIETYNDHRMAMCMALIGLKVPGIVIDNPACVAKTYPRFFEDLATLRK